MRTSDAARYLGVSANTLRALDRRFGLLNHPQNGSHRQFPPQLVRALRDALDEGMAGFALVERAHELANTRSYKDSTSMREQLATLEREISRLRGVVEHLIRAVDQYRASLDELLDIKTRESR